MYVLSIIVFTRESTNRVAEVLWTCDHPITTVSLSDANFDTAIVFCVTIVFCGVVDAPEYTTTQRDTHVALIINAKDVDQSRYWQYYYNVLKYSN